MMKNKAGWVALIVLAIASLLMFFFVLPNRGANKPADVATTPVAEQTPVAERAQPSAGDQTADGKAARPAESGSVAADTTKAADTAKADTAKADTAKNATGTDVATPETAPATTPADVEKSGETPAETKPSLPTPEVAAVDTSKPAAADPTAQWTVPGFDLLRVEPDGSTVIAGKAQPGTSLEVVDGDNVVAKADVGSTGDFAAVLDEPLPPGDYQLTLRSVGKDGASKTSVEVATVSVPEDIKGELLAMVSKPGEASRVITTPEAKPSVDGVTPAAGTVDAASTPARGDDAAGEPAGDTPATDKPATDTPGGTAVDRATPPALADPTTSRVTAADDPAAAASGAQTAALADDAAAATGSESQAKPAIPTGTATDAATALAKLPAALSVSAVEIEGNKIFVAGNATPGAIVRIYANDQLVGQAKADGAGRFVVDGVLALAVGRHTIRADMLSADGRRVEFRAAVPFDRPEGELVAAVAEPQAAATPAGAVTAGMLDGGSFDALRSEATKAFTLLKGLFSGSRLPEAEQLAAARSATEIALRSLAEARLAETVDAGLRATAERISAAARAAFTLLKGLPQDPGSVSAALAKIETAIGPVLVAQTPTGTGNAAGAAPTDASPVAGDTGAAAASETTTKPATGGTSTAPTTAVTPAQVPADTTVKPASGGTAAGSGTATGGEAVAEPQTVEQAPLKQSKTSVIIRRGDTLWQISRRVYGAGVRYTTIYLANEDQIQDPDRILPGQIFGVPDTAMPDAESEQIHRKHMTGHD